MNFDRWGNRILLRPSHCTWKLRKQVKIGGATYSRIFFKFILNKVVFLVRRAMVTNHRLEFV